MILNAYSVLAAFAALLRVVLGCSVLVVGVRAWRRWRLGRELPTAAGENRFYLLFALSATLLGLAVVSWPLLYLVLQSYVPVWPGVMCIQGVTRVGLGSVGAASSLPGLVGFLEVVKPALVFAAGVWLLLHLANRRGTGALTGRTMGALLLFGLLATADGAAELAYLVIPKKETFLAAGCCTIGADAGAGPGSGLLAFLVAPPEQSRSWLTPVFLSVGFALVLAISMSMRRLRLASGGGRWLALSLAGALASLPLGLAFASGVAAPAFLHLPYHECPYCLLSSAPESIVGIGLYVVGAFGVGWACAARWLGASASGNGPPLRLLNLARFGYAGALLMVSVKLASL